MLRHSVAGTGRQKFIQTVHSRSQYRLYAGAIRLGALTAIIASADIDSTGGYSSDDTARLTDISSTGAHQQTTTGAIDSPVDSSTGSSNSRPSMMDVLPLALLLVMGVVISTTCGKYTSSQSPTTTSTSAGIIGTAQASTSDSSAGALAAANLYDSSGDRDVPIVDSNGAHVDTGAKHRQLDSLSSSALIDTSMFSRQSSSASQPSSSQGSHHSTRLNALLTANQPSNRSPAPPPSPPPPPPPQQQPQHRHHYNHNHNKHFVLNSDSSSGGSSRHTGAEQHRNHYNNHAYQSDGTPTYYRPYYLSRQMLTNTSVTCNDGTVAGYYIRQNYASRRWIVFLEGGWYCFSALTCHQRWLKMRGLMTSAHWPEAKTGMCEHWYWRACVGR
ncbi:unnamed protein product [Oppiella nova]|uniref:Uncharacterized protein n=1 Tax=Oppiella nova TaxID=334625 RepID=A0A7R9LMQ9_9ACAR|nr:unnamed protein product [Oppiella nova]CAG2164552.1 unnamed protein product [Oppiella nova]